MKIAEIIACLEKLAPPAWQEEYDNSGLIAGDPDTEFRAALLCLDVTEAVINEASARGCNLIISHHPPVFRALKRFTPDRPEARVLTEAIRRDLALYAVHTNLDNALNGLNAWLLRTLGAGNHRILRARQEMLLKLAVFCPSAHAADVRQAMFEAGAGHIGNYDHCSFNLAGEGTFRASEAASPFVGEKNQEHTEPEIRIEVILPRNLSGAVIRAMLAAHPYEEVAYDLYPLANETPGTGSGLVGTLPVEMNENAFLDLVKRKLGCTVIRHSAFTGRPVSRVALCSGSGGFLIEDAARSGAGIYLSADLKYHDFQKFEGKMVIADIGHYESEIWVKEWFRDVLIEKFPTFAFFISETDTNPVLYF